jgi:hypothetical protein
MKQTFGPLILCLVLLSASSSYSQSDELKLLRAATTRPWSGENFPALPSLSTGMQSLVVGEIMASPKVKDAFTKLDAKGKNVDWFIGVEELEEQKAVWSLQSCLIHPSEDVQIHALRSLEQIKDKRAVPFLLIYAEYMAIDESGSENATIHGIIQESIAKALSSLTGLKVQITGQDSELLKQSIKKWRKWLVENDSSVNKVVN